MVTPSLLALALERHNRNHSVRLLVALSPAPDASGLRQSALYLLWRSTQDEFEPVTGKGFAKCAQGCVSEIDGDATFLYDPLLALKPKGFMCRASG